MSDHIMMSRMYSLVAEMEALKVDIETIKIESQMRNFLPGYKKTLLEEKSNELRGIANELQQLGH